MRALRVAAHAAGPAHARRSTPARRRPLGPRLAEAGGPGPRCHVREFRPPGRADAGLSAAFAGCVETGGGLLLVLGLLTPVAAALVTVVMLGAGWFAGHWFGGVTGDDGWELVGVIIAGVLSLAATGPVASASTTSWPGAGSASPRPSDPGGGRTGGVSGFNCGMSDDAVPVAALFGMAARRGAGGEGR